MRILGKVAGLLGLAGVLLLPLDSVQAGPKIENWTTDQGLRVYFVAAPQLPMVDMRLTFAAGGARDGDKPGLAAMTVSMLDQGASGLNADQLAEAFESVGAQFGSGAARDMAWVSLRTLTLENEMKSALDTWLKVLARPDFPEKEFLNIQKMMLLDLQAEKQSPEAIGSKAFFPALFGDHPYASPANGTEDSISAMTRTDLQDFFQRYYVSRNAVLAVVGALDRTQVEAIADRVSGVLAEGEKAPALPPVTPLAEARTIRIPFPSEQAHITIGQTGYKKGDPDQFPLYLGNQILGGGSTSRLNKEIRQNRGLSYSVYSYFASMGQDGPFIMGLQTRMDQTDEALKVMRETLESYRTDGPSDNELEAAQKDITGGFPLQTASNDDIVSYLGMIGFYGLPLDYLDTFTANINAVSREAIVEAFQRRVQPDKLLTVIVGGGSEAAQAGAPADAGATRADAPEDKPRSAIDIDAGEPEKTAAGTEAEAE
ncbi:MAG: insulinase family protein [Thiothrix sp.]|nr:insulinase family protein [Thiothrix sp.]HPQ94584.1 pitrilysin family protein [Thiolinea sp.]